MKRQLTVTMLLSSLLTISGCTTPPKPSAEMLKITNQQSEIEGLKTQQAELSEKLHILQAMQPKLDRLVEMESKLTSIIQQEKDRKQADKIKAREEKRKQRENRPFFMLQTASLHSLDKLKATWLEQQILFPKILNGLPARYQQVSVRGKQYYRLKSGEFSHKAEAIKTCQALIAQQASCIVVNNKGTKF